MRATFIDTLTGIAEKNDDVFVISGDAGFGVFERYRELKPERFINAGIAEANTIGYAAGLSMMGFNVFVYNIVPFVLYRCYEQVRNDICYQRLPVTLIGIGSGLTYAPGGMTHYSVEDLTVCLSLPNLTVISPVDGVETKGAVEYAALSNSPVYIRIAKSGEPVMKERRDRAITSPEIIREGRDIAVITHGPVAIEAMNAAEELLKKGIHVKVISMPTIQPLDMKTLLGDLDDVSTVFVLEEHFRQGGLYTRLLGTFHELGINKRLHSLAIPNSFIHDINHQAGMRTRFGIDAASLVRAVEKSIQ